MINFFIYIQMGVSEFIKKCTLLTTGHLKIKKIISICKYILHRNFLAVEFSRWVIRSDLADLTDLEVNFYTLLL